MNYQAICAALEAPLNNAFIALTPPVKVFFDNLIVMPPDPPGEYVMVNITFGLTSESTLTNSLDRARGAIIVRIFTEKGRGGRRARQLAGVASQIFSILGATKRPATGTFVRVHDVSGPNFYMDEAQPHFMARLSATWDATSCG
jgi:hypothetical protein